MEIEQVDWLHFRTRMKFVLILRFFMHFLCVLQTQMISNQQILLFMTINIRHTALIPYCLQETKIIHLFADLISDAPIFVFVHGGYWHLDFDKTNSAYMAEPLYRAGLKVVVLDYDLCPNVTLEQMVKLLFYFDFFFYALYFNILYVCNRWNRFRGLPFRS